MERDLDWFDSPSRAAHASAEQAAPEPAPAVHPQPAAHDAEAHPLPPPEPIRHAGPTGVSAPLPAPEPLPSSVPVTLATPPAPPSWSAMQPPFIEPPDGAAERSPQSPPAAPVAQSSRFATTSLIADAFSALLAAEQGEGDASSVRLPIAGTTVVTDELVDAVAERVIERLGSRAAHDVVADVVSRVAERLVREEIDRIRRRG